MSNWYDKLSQVEVDMTLGGGDGVALTKAQEALVKADEAVELAKNAKGEKGDQGPQGEPGVGAEELLEPPFDGDNILQKSTRTGELLYEVVFDTNGLVLTNSNMRVKYDFYSEDARITSIGSRVFTNNDPALGVVTGGTSHNNGFTATYTNGSVLSYDQVRTDSYTTGNRYIHLFVLVTLSDIVDPLNFFLRNISFSVPRHYIEI